LLQGAVGTAGVALGGGRDGAGSAALGARGRRRSGAMWSGGTAALGATGIGGRNDLRRRLLHSAIRDFAKCWEEEEERVAEGLYTREKVAAGLYTPPLVPVGASNRD
jgi:hypothetical protein